MAGIATEHPDYVRSKPAWQKIEDITRRRRLVNYLVDLNSFDQTPENKARNESYKERAIFYGFSNQTVQSMIGSVYRRWPTLTVPTMLEYLKTNADGAGISIYQQSQGLFDDVLRKGRAGLAVSFPQAEGQVSRQDMMQGRMVATIHRFEPEQILNWRTRRIGSKVALELVVLREIEFEVSADGYTVEAVEIIREMFLDDGGTYNERRWSKSTGQWVAEEPFTPRKADGTTWDLIPFAFVGSENNDPSPDSPPMEDIVDVNIGHYRNSADYEDSVWFVGQAQPWMSGVTQDHLDMMSENSMYVGSRQMLGVPSGETFGFAQPAPNMLVKEAMEMKVELMIALGARLMQVGSAVKTADQSRGEREASMSVLGLIAENVSEAYTKALEWVSMYMGTNGEESVYELNRDFVELDMSPEKLQQIMRGFLEGTVPLPDYTRFMRKQGLFSDETSDEDYAATLTLGGGE